MNYTTLEIKVVGKHTRLFLDGVEQTNWTEFQFVASANHLPRLTTTTIPDVAPKSSLWEQVKAHQEQRKEGFNRATPEDANGDGYPEGALS